MCHGRHEEPHAAYATGKFGGEYPTQYLKYVGGTRPSHWLGEFSAPKYKTNLGTPGLRQALVLFDAPNMAQSQVNILLQAKFHVNEIVGTSGLRFKHCIKLFNTKMSKYAT